VGGAADHQAATALAKWVKSSKTDHNVRKIAFGLNNILQPVTVNHPLLTSPVHLQTEEVCSGADGLSFFTLAINSRTDCLNLRGPSFKTRDACTKSGNPVDIAPSDALFVSHAARFPF
jgi:hypothetical protein